jgi:hypothetical protein
MMLRRHDERTLKMRRPDAQTVLGEAEALHDSRQSHNYVGYSIKNSNYKVKVVAGTQAIIRKRDKTLWRNY